MIGNAHNREMIVKKISFFAQKCVKGVDFFEIICYNDLACINICPARAGIDWRINFYEKENQHNAFLRHT